MALHTVGRRSGEARMTLLTCFVDEEGRRVVVASNAGSDRHPAWFLNLEAQPTAEIVVNGRRQQVKARRAEGAERDRLWQHIVGRRASYAAYAADAGREIPVVVLEPQ